MGSTCAATRTYYRLRLYTGRTHVFSETQCNSHNSAFAGFFCCLLTEITRRWKWKRADCDCQPQIHFPRTPNATSIAVPTDNEHQKYFIETNAIRNCYLYFVQVQTKVIKTKRRKEWTRGEDGKKCIDNDRRFRFGRKSTEKTLCISSEHMVAILSYCNVRCTLYFPPKQSACVDMIFMSFVCCIYWLSDSPSENYDTQTHCALSLCPFVAFAVVCNGALLLFSLF